MIALGIVGHAAEKFVCRYADGVVDVPSTAAWEKLAREAIRGLIARHDPQWVISGRSPMGGIDVWAIEEARRLGVKTFEFPPEFNGWPAYRKRNLQIARKCEHVAVVVMQRLPGNYQGGVAFEKCYHCEGQPDYPGGHVKSGGCWTARRAKSREWIILTERMNA